MIHLGLAGAVLAELFLERRLALVDEGTRRTRGLVGVVDEARFGDPVLDAALTRLARARRRGNARRVVGSIGRIPKLRHLVATQLCRRGILRGTEEQVVFFFHRRVYPTVDPAPERALVARVRSALDDASAVVDDRTAILIGLAEATGALRAIYDRKQVRALKPRLEVLRTTEADNPAAREGVEAARAAIAATSAAIVAAAG